MNTFFSDRTNREYFQKAPREHIKSPQLMKNLSLSPGLTLDEINVKLALWLKNRAEWEFVMNAYKEQLATSPQDVLLAQLIKWHNLYLSQNQEKTLRRLSKKMAKIGINQDYDHIHILAEAFEELMLLF